MLDKASSVLLGQWQLVTYFWCSAWGGGAVTSTSRHSGPNGGSDKPGLSWRPISLGSAGGRRLVAPWPRGPVAPAAWP